MRHCPLIKGFRVLAACLVLVKLPVALFAVQAAAYNVEIVVVDSSGMPIPGCLVSCNSVESGRYITKSDEDGKATAKCSFPWMLVEHSNYAARFLHLEDLMDRKVKLLDRAELNWVIPLCRDQKQRPEQRLGLPNLKLPRTSGARFRRYGDEWEEITLNNTGATLRSWKRTISTGLPGIPPKVAELSSKPIELYGVRGHDVVIRTPDGRRSRWVVTPVARAVYEGVTSGEAEMFDKMIEQACVEVR